MTNELQRQYARTFFCSPSAYPPHPSSLRLPCPVLLSFLLSADGSWHHDFHENESWRRMFTHVAQRFPTMGGHLRRHRAALHCLLCTRTTLHPRGQPSHNPGFMGLQVKNPSKSAGNPAQYQATTPPFPLHGPMSRHAVITGPLSCICLTEAGMT